MVDCFLVKLSQVKALVRIAFVVLLVVAASVHALSFGNEQRSAKCQKCNSEYRQLTSLIEREVAGADRQWCAACYNFLRCFKSLELTCRTDLNFEGGRSLIMSHMKRYTCDGLKMTWNETLDIIAKLRAPKVQHLEAKKTCGGPKFKPVYKVCGLFGDPHLQTFDDKRHTCSVPGAWPLFVNRYLTVQVTNIPLENSARATATSKVTVIVRGMEKKCIEQKMYQAKSFSLPAVFSDGTKSSNHKKCPTRVSQIAKGRVVEIDICPLRTKIIIRQVGKYLIVHMRIPQDLMRTKTFGLCRHGCPRIERMNLDRVSEIDNVIASLYEKDKPSKRVRKQRSKRARRLCRNARVTGFYYKSCLFDLLTSNDASFARAARAAMKDFRKINKDDSGRPIVNETTREHETKPTKGLTGSQTIYRRPTLHGPSSRATRVGQTSLVAQLTALAVLLMKTLH